MHRYIRYTVRDPLYIRSTVRDPSNCGKEIGLLAKRIEYILKWNLLETSVKRRFCCTVSIQKVYFTYLCYITFWALEHHFIENLKSILKENKIMK